MQDNFQDATANSLLKIIEEPHSGVTFIFLTRYKDDVLSGDENEALTDDYPFPVDCLWQECSS